MTAATGEQVFIDLHCHTSASFDSLSSPARVVTVAHERGLTHLAVTDHERIDGALEARDVAARLTGAGLTVIVGEEIRSADGDIIGLYLERAIPPGLSAVETVAAIHEQGGLAGLPHPFDRFRNSGLKDRHGQAPSGLEALAASLDYVESFNARVPYPSANERAAAFAHEHGLPGVASSDAHSLLEVGIAYTHVAGPVRDGDELRLALADLSLVMQRGSFAARGLTPLAKLIQRARGNVRVRPAPPAPATAPPPGGH